MNLLNSFKTLIISNLEDGYKTFNNETLTADNVFDDHLPDRDYKAEPTVEISEVALTNNHFLNGADVLTDISIHVRTHLRDTAVNFADWINEIIDDWLKIQRANKYIEDYLLVSSKVTALERGLELGTDYCNVATFTIYY